MANGVDVPQMPWEVEPPLTGPAGPPGEVTKEELNAKLLPKASKEELAAGLGGKVDRPAGAEAQDIMVFSGGTWARLAVGKPGEALVIRSDGTLHYEKMPVIALSAWEAKGTGSGNNDTAAMQAALNAAPVGTIVKGAYGSTYSASNLIFPNTAHLVLDLSESRLVARPEGDETYLIATQHWLENNAEPGEEGQAIQNGTILASETATYVGAKKNAIVAMSRRFTVYNCDISRAAECGILLSARTKNETPVNNSLVESKIEKCRVHECQTFGIRTLDPDTFRITDGFLTNNIVFNCGTSAVKIDKLSGWDFGALHTYQTGSGLSSAAYVPGTNWDLDVGNVGVSGQIHNCKFESGCVRMKGFTQTHTPQLSNLMFGQTAPNGATVRLEAEGESAVAALDNCIFYGPTTANNFTFLTVTGLGAGNPFCVHINGGNFGFRTPINWTGKVAVFLKNVKVFQEGHNVPPDLICDGFMPTSNIRPPGIVYRTAVPSSAAEEFQVGDRWVNTAPAKGGSPGGICTVAGKPGTWAAEAVTT